MARRVPRNSDTAELRERMRKYRNPNKRNILEDEKIPLTIRVIIGALIVVTGLLEYAHQYGFDKVVISWLHR